MNNFKAEVSNSVFVSSLLKTRQMLVVKKRHQVIMFP